MNLRQRFLFSLSCVCGGGIARAERKSVCDYLTHIDIILVDFVKNILHENN